MGKVYTRTGDCGTTGIRGGERVPKDDPRIEANGCLDELNCKIGEVRSVMAAEDPLNELLRTVQKDLMAVMRIVATPSDTRGEDCGLPESASDHWCEEHVDMMLYVCGRMNGFVLPGGSPCAAGLHSARAIARRAERRLWTLHRTDPLPETVLRYMNRLSDLLFVTARYCNLKSGQEEETWK